MVSWWNSLNAHTRTQVWRFVRTFIWSYLTAAQLGHPADTKTFLALIVPALETTYRKLNPATPDAITGSAEPPADEDASAPEDMAENEDHGL